MTLRIELSPYGEPALQTLRTLIDDIKGDNPLQPVTVLVARSAVGLGVRRALASGATTNGRLGVANVTFDTLAGLADTIAGATMAEEGRLPMTDAVLRASMHTVLAAAPGSLLGVTQDHPSTVDALVATYRELRGVDDVVLDRLKGTSIRSAEVVSVLNAVRQAMSAWFDEVDALEEAARLLRVENYNLDARTGPLVLYLPSVISPPQAELIRRCAAQVDVVAIVGVTGDVAADELSRRMVSALSPGHAFPSAAEVAVPVGDIVLSAPSADAEVLMVVRDLMERCERGLPLERAVIAHSGSAQYVTLLHNTLQGSGIPFNGSGVRPLSSTVAGRTLLGALSLPDHNWRREDVAAWFSTGPLVDGDGVLIPAVRWGLLSTVAGVTEGLEAWDTRVAAAVASLRAEAMMEGVDDDGARQRALQAEARHGEELVAFVIRLAEKLEANASNWRNWAAWAKGLLHDLFGGSKSFEAWPADERAAAQAVEEAIDRLAVLENLETKFSTVAARAALSAELALPAPQTSRFGVGVWVAPITSVVGHRLDVLYVVGMNDGVFPGAPADDVLIPDREREGADEGDGVPLRSARSVGMRRDYLAALAGSSIRVLSFPRGNQRDGRDLRPSRWLLDSLGEVVGSSTRIYNNVLGEVPATERYRIEPSFMSTVGAPGCPISVGDRDVRSLLSWTLAGQHLSAHFLCAAGTPLGLGVEFLAGRRGGFTRFNGNVTLVLAGRDLVPPILSATRLEAFATCPRHYFFESVLGVSPRPTDERILSTDRMERGTLLHGILESYVRPILGRRVEDAEGFLGVDRLLAVADEEMLRFEADGLAGPRAAWEMEKVQIRRELRRFAEDDLAWRQKEGAVTLAAERKFGFDESPPIAVAVPDGQPVHFRGQIDRVDVTRSGTKVVIDYKSGSAVRFKDIDKDHFRAGTALQLAVYGSVVADDDPEPVRSEYWFIGEKGAFERPGYTLTVDELVVFSQVVGTLADTLRHGQFPANPEPVRGQKLGPCTYCPYDSVCPPDRHQVWERSKADEALAGYVGLGET